MYEKDGKRYPFEISEFYSVGLNSLKRVYTQHPKFNGNVRLIYELLFDHWNGDFGYAFPDQWELARESGQSVSSVKRNIKVLKELDLIEVSRSPIGRKNNVYYIKKPVSTIEEFYRKFPEIEKESRERIARIDAERDKAIEKWDKDEQAGEKYTQRNSFLTYANPSKHKEGEAVENGSLKDIEAWL